MKFLKMLMVLCILLLFATQVNALPIKPTSGDLEVSRWEGTNETSERVILGLIAPEIGDAVELYKANVGGREEKLLMGSYKTTFNGSASGGSIEHTGGDIIGPDAFLLVKDGNHVPSWYLFDLTKLTWDGEETLVLSGFWPGPGAISNVSIFGSRVPVPEPSTMLLLGCGLIGLAAFGRKRLFQK